MIQIINSPWELVDPDLKPSSFHLTIEDDPFNLSEVERNTFGVRPQWDFGWSPLGVVASDARLLVPGGWSVKKISDRLFGSLRDIISGDHSNTLTYINWLHNMSIIGNDAYTEALCNLDRQFAHLPQFEYKASIVWVKNSGAYIRGTTFLSRHELFCVARRLDESGRSVEAPAWNFLSINAMKNWFECPPCGAGEKLYWHIVEPFEEDGQVRGKIVPCKNESECDLCAQGYERRCHPCQTPVYVWHWFLERIARQGLNVRDRFGGVFSLAMACQKKGINYLGTDVSWEYCRVGEMWVGGEFWEPPKTEEPAQINFLDGLE